jgi:hypothetical protein
VTLFLGLVVLVLAGAIVVLFAMLGELSSRVPGPADEEARRRLEAIEEARTGHRPDRWPPQLASLAEQEFSLLFVLSSSCSSCRRIAGQMSRMLDQGPVNFAVVVACPSRERGEQFAAAQGIDRLVVHIDENGAWSTGEFGIDTSPAALVFHRGRLQSALLFWDLPAVLSAVGALGSARQEQEEVV